MNIQLINTLVKLLKTQFSLSLIATMAIWGLCVYFYNYNINPQLSQNSCDINIDDVESIRVKDLLKINNAIYDFKNNNGYYPITKEVRPGVRGFTGVSVDPWNGESRAEWITGLAPKYLDELPRDPSLSDSYSPQYIYTSDGTYFKLIAINAPDFLEIRRTFPCLIDPNRPYWAYGFWSKTGKNR